MFIPEVIKSNQEFYKLSSPDETIQYYNPGTGPYQDLVSCDYFVTRVRSSTGDIEFQHFQTSIDLYPDEILEDIWFLYKPNKGGE
jgi:hypothetical protein